MAELDYLELLLAYATFHAFFTVMASMYWAVGLKDEFSLVGTIKEINILTFVGVSLFYPWGLFTLLLYVIWGFYRLVRWRDVTAKEIAEVIVADIEAEEEKKREEQEERDQLKAQAEQRRAREAQIKRDQVRLREERLRDAQTKLEHWDKLDGHDFESEFAGLLRRNGWQARETKKSGDAGIDIEAQDPNGRSVVIECKRWRQEAKVGREVVQKLYGAAMNQYDRVVVVTTASFTDEAVQYAKKAKVELWGRRSLLDLIRSASNKVE